MHKFTFDEKVSFYVDQGIHSFNDKKLNDEDRCELVYLYLLDHHNWEHHFFNDSEKSEQMINMFIEYIGNPSLKNAFSALDILEKTAIDFYGDQIQKIFKEAIGSYKENDPCYKPKSWQDIMAEDVGVSRFGAI